MKIFAVQKTQANTYSQFSQNNSVNQNPVMKTNLTGDKFVSKVSFGMARLDDLYKKNECLLALYDAKKITFAELKKLTGPINDEIGRLENPSQLGPLESEGTETYTPGPQSWW